MPFFPYFYFSIGKLVFFLVFLPAQFPARRQKKNNNTSEGTPNGVTSTTLDVVNRRGACECSALFCTREVAEAPLLENIFSGVERSEVAFSILLLSLFVFFIFGKQFFFFNGGARRNVRVLSVATSPFSRSRLKKKTVYFYTFNLVQRRGNKNKESSVKGRLRRPDAGPSTRRIV